MATVTFDHVYKRYGDVTAVSDLNLEIGDGEFMVLVGPSGCGKTTSLRMIAGLEEISDGQLRIGDRVVNDVAPKDRDIAMVFQSYALYPHMSVRDNLAFGLKLRKVPKSDIDKRISEAAGFLQLEKLLDRKPKELSGGQRQRVALGRAISARVWTRSLASRFESGSSIKNTAGSRTIARPSATRWRWPPESSFGLRSRSAPSWIVSAASLTRRSISAFGTLRSFNPNARFSRTDMCG